ncbi:MAG: right-handed parallel beta-helix repeat-containing protein, partial [Planctomycetota bacterium]
TYKTILSGDLNGDDVEVNDPCDLLTEPSRAENSYHVVTGIDCNENAVLDGFTITAGNANREGYPFHHGSGGGIQIRFGEMREVGPVLKNCTFIGNSARWGGGMDNNHCSTTLTNCTFSENFAEWGGGGIGIAGYAGPKLINCTFTANRAGYKGGAVANGEGRFTLENCTLIANHAELGGAIYNGDAGAILTDCTLIGNYAERGGVVYNSSDSSVRMTNCLVSENSCTEEGGVVYLRSEDSATLTNCILTANSAEKGGVLYAGDDSYARLANCTVTGNWATDNGGALYFDGPDGAKITNCILWSDTPQEIYPDLLGNEIVITYNDVQGGWPGQGNIDVDPCFFDAGYWDANGVWIDGNYYLLQTSACINAGDNNSLPVDIQDLDGDSNTTEPIPYDLDGNPRIIYDVVDMGASEFDNTAPIADAGDDRTIECACNTEQGTKVTLDGTNSTDSDGGLLTYIWTGPFVESPAHGAAPMVTLEEGCPGDYGITLVVDDGIDESEPNEVVIRVVDTTPPAFEFSVAPAMLWPPDHKMVEITPSWTVSDDCDTSPDVSLVSIAMNEGDNTIGDGHTTNDIQIGKDGSIYLRSERSGTGNDRVYTITYQAVDDCGNTTIRSANVSIPHDFKVLAKIAARWLWTGPPGSIPADLNGDGVVNLSDFARFAGNWSK